jgi:hypothetical protein
MSQEPHTDSYSYDKVNNGIEIRIHPSPNSGSAIQGYLKMGIVRGLLKIPVFLLTIPLGWLLTIIGMVGFTCLVIILSPFYMVRYILWRLSAKGRIQQLLKIKQEREQILITHQQHKRLKLSENADKADIKFLVKLSKHEITKRKNHIDYIIFVETKRQLNRCRTEMNFDDALRIHSTIVNTELDLLNEALNQLFK